MGLNADKSWPELYVPTFLHEIEDTERFGAHARTTVDGRVLLGIENFSMCVRRAAYAAYPNWQQGFSVIYLEPRSGEFHWYPVMIRKGGFVWRGRVYDNKHANEN